jgi:hypothetical protein
MERSFVRNVTVCLAILVVIASLVVWLVHDRREQYRLAAAVPTFALTIFAELDANNDGILIYDELNVNLQSEEANRILEFMRRHLNQFGQVVEIKVVINTKISLPGEMTVSQVLPERHLIYGITRSDLHRIRARFS